MTKPKIQLLLFLFFLSIYILTGQGSIQSVDGKIMFFLTQAMVESMQPGSIIVDLAVERGGNCPLSKPGEVVEHQGVKIMGYLNVPGRLAVDASSLYARNLFNFMSPFVDSETGSVNIDWEDELVIGTCLTRNGDIVHANFKQEKNP